MATIGNEQLAYIVREYSLGKSVKEIADEYKVSIDAMYYFMRRHNIPRRSSAESNREKFNRKPLSFRLKQNLTESDKILHAIAVSLYWAEGYKTSSAGGIDLANSDSAIIKVFLVFLRKICGVDEHRLRVLLYCHDKREIPRLIAYWSKLTGIPPGQFSKPYVSPYQNSKRTPAMPNGLIHVRYCDKKLLQQMLRWIEELKK